MKYIFLFVEFKHTEFFTSYGDYLLNAKLQVPSVGFSVARSRSPKIQLLSISKFFVCCCHSNIVLFKTTFWQILIHRQLLVKILQRSDKEKSIFKAIEKYGLWKTVSKHLKVKSIKMFTERLCDKGIGNVLNFPIEVSLGE